MRLGNEENLWAAAEAEAEADPRALTWYAGTKGGVTSSSSTATWTRRRRLGRAGPKKRQAPPRKKARLVRLVLVGHATTHVCVLHAWGMQG